MNYYQRLHVRHRRGVEPLRRLEVRHRDRGGCGLTDMGWEEHPEGLAAVLREAAAFGLPLLVTENGIATEDGARKARSSAATSRCSTPAAARGIDIRGYFYWSLTDTYEWLHGCSSASASTAWTGETLERTPTAAAATTRDSCASAGGAHHLLTAAASGGNAPAQISAWHDRRNARPRGAAALRLPHPHPLSPTACSSCRRSSISSGRPVSTRSRSPTTSRPGRPRSAGRRGGCGSR